MSKFKFDIKTRDLSWEKTYPKICDKEQCNEIGEYKAPKSRIKLKEYYYFCLNHVKEYNKSWDFYKGLTVNQIELAMCKDTIWDRPSWPLKGKPSRISKDVEQLVISERRKHSQKPDCIKEKIVELCGDVPRIEFFARQKTLGWSCWGDEV